MDPSQLVLTVMFHSDHEKNPHETETKVKTLKQKTASRKLKVLKCTQVLQN